MGWSGLERNKLDYILTDLLPVEISELFSFSQFYSFLLQHKQQKTIDNLIQDIRKAKAQNKTTMFKEGWASKPLKYRILKGATSTREMSVIQPLSALNVFLFIDCYQADILHYFEKHHNFSLRYHKKNQDLFYKAKKNKAIQYFQSESYRVGRGVIQQVGNYFKVAPFESINSFAGSRIWRMCNFEYKYYAKTDYKACFDSIYTHAFTWIIERNTVDAKAASNSHLFVTIDRILQNINGRSSNGIVVGPEFSRMMAELLLQHIDSEVIWSLEKEGIQYNVDYVAFRYVDDIFLFANQPNTIEKILEKYQTLGEKYLLRLNELKLLKGDTPSLPKEWLEKTRKLSDEISGFFYQGKKTDFDKRPENERFLVKPEFISVDRLKDKIAVLIKSYLEDKRTIVSFLLSTLLNNISKKKDGYTLFDKQQLGKAMLLIDIALYIYAFYPSFDQTRKIISILTYINKEINFKGDSGARTKLNNAINRYSFVFLSGNVFDLCDWFPFFYEYSVVLDAKTEVMLIEKAEQHNDPIIWANLLLYSKYYQPFFEELKAKVNTIVSKQISRISDKQPMMQVEFWYILVFHNCPYLSPTLQKQMSDLINSIRATATKSGAYPSSVCIQLVCDFLQQQSSGGKKPAESLFNWKGINNFGDQITYRTYQRTVFKRYKKGTYGLYASLD